MARAMSEPSVRVGEPKVSRMEAPPGFETGINPQLSVQIRGLAATPA
jgi:hypothetical protein